MQKAAIVILNYNGGETLRKFLPSVIRYSKFPIIIADNASEDHSLEVLEKFPEVQVIRLDKNYGFAGGYTRVLESFKGNYQYYILLNSDVEVTENWDSGLIDWLDSHPDVAALQPKILSYPRPDNFDHAGAGGGFLDVFGYPYCRGRFFDHIEKDEGQYDDDLMVDWTSGACMAIREEAFHKGKGFDGDYFAHMEEIDLCWRLRRMGYSLYYTGSVKVYHVGGATLSPSNPQKTYLNFRNSLLTLRKNLPNLYWSAIYISRIFLDMLASTVFFFKNEKKHSKMIIKAHLDFLKMHKKYEKELGPRIPPRGRVRFLLWNFYIMGKRKYTEV
ncbi:glycosyltransferase family 2 protein [Shivajiella indica]|uniref:Glycosyltransferase family 2 protein n=1 Tax=Shivajiella indica TaxID=872115 RepID=A0ABW5B8M0_9BACT